MAFKEIAVFCNLTVWGIQKLGIILENKMSEKNVFYPKWSPKLVFLNEKKSDVFWTEKIDFESTPLDTLPKVA